VCRLLERREASVSIPSSHRPKALQRKSAQQRKPAPQQQPVDQPAPVTRTDRGMNAVIEASADYLRRKGARADSAEIQKELVRSGILEDGPRDRSRITSYLGRATLAGVIAARHPAAGLGPGENAPRGGPEGNAAGGLGKIWNGDGGARTPASRAGSTLGFDTTYCRLAERLSQWSEQCCGAKGARGAFYPHCCTGFSSQVIDHLQDAPEQVRAALPRRPSGTWCSGCGQ
jgi:hypothetical protein